MDLELGGKTAIVTGASQGIGAAIAGVLAEEGVDVCLVARNKENLEKVAAGIKSRSNRRVVTHAADLMDANAPAEAVKAAVDAFGRLDIVVNNAGATKRGSFFELADEDWVNGFGLKFFATMRMTRAAWPHLKASQGAIVNIIGVGSRVAQADYTVGGPVNSALVNFTKATADAARPMASASTPSIPATSGRRASRSASTRQWSGSAPRIAPRPSAGSWPSTPSTATASRTRSAGWWRICAPRAPASCTARSSISTAA